MTQKCDMHSSLIESRQSVRSRLSHDDGTINRVGGMDDSVATGCKINNTKLVPLAGTPKTSLTIIARSSIVNRYLAH
jgi:hypothetical protein